jgi:hypothetical protein
MSQKDFKNLFLENILEFLWRQWSAIGVLGEARTEDPWLIDPEAMLIFTLDMGRYEPRLFDKVMDWLAVNGKWIDLQRLRGILQRKDKTTKGLMGAVAAYLVEESNERKWKNLANLFKIQLPVDGDHAESLFYQKDGQPYPMLGNPDRCFLSYGFHRPGLKLRRLTREAPITAQSTIRFLLRALFGVGSRAECLIYLLTHDGGHPAEVAKAIGLSIRGTQDALIDLSRSGLVLTRIKGKRKIEYWLSHKRWWDFLSRGSITEIEKPVWIDWIALYSALSQLWTTLDEMSREGLSDYMRSSRLRDCLESVGNELSRSGLDIPTIPGRDIRPQEYERAFETFIIRVFGAK